MCQNDPIPEILKLFNDAIVWGAYNGPKATTAQVEEKARQFALRAVVEQIRVMPPLELALGRGGYRLPSATKS